MQPPEFIAEVSSNHNRDLARCLSFVDVAADIGCRAVKFQLFKIDKLFAREVLLRSEEHQRRRDWELPVEFLPEIASRCVDRGIRFVCTPFYLDAVAELRPFVDAYKVASYELLWDDLLRSCASTGKPVILSTGMATTEEISDAVATLRGSGCRDLTVLHCVSGYPTPPADCNLAAIDTLRHELRCPIGWSDHSANAGVVYRAVHHWGAEVVEFHMDLDTMGVEHAGGHCWLPEAIGRVIADVQAGFEGDGAGQKTPTPSEAAEREWRADPQDGLRPLRSIRDGWGRDE